MIPLESFRLEGDGRKWKVLCEQRHKLAKRLHERTKHNIVQGEVLDLRAGLGFKRTTFFRRMGDLRKLGVLKSIGRIGYQFDLSRLKPGESGTN